jgi:hypothetical protein
MSQYVPTRYKVLCSINKRYHVRNYVQVRRGIYTYRLGVKSVLMHIYILASRATTREVSAVTLYKINIYFKV